LEQLPPDDQSRVALQGGITRATEKLVASGGKVAEAPAAKPAARLKVRVDLAAELKGRSSRATASSFARATSGPPAPLAAKRLTVADLPVTVELGDADAMMPQLKLSNFPEVQLVARISRAGQPTAGEWVGRSQPLASSTTAPQTLTIDSPDNNRNATMTAPPHHLAQRYFGAERLCGPTATRTSGPATDPVVAAGQPRLRPPGKSTTPAKPAKPPRTSASFAPPPGGNSHWDPKLGVYVLDDQPNTFYRQRTYYRWDNGWSRLDQPERAVGRDGYPRCAGRFGAAIRAVTQRRP
jgi:hypothetical protein